MREAKDLIAQICDDVETIEKVVKKDCEDEVIDIAMNCLKRTKTCLEKIIEDSNTFYPA